MSIRQAIYGDNDPYADVKLVEEDLQGWRVAHPLLIREAAKAETIAEIGVWKGAGIKDMAENSSAEILAVDTFRGSVEHWARPRWQDFVQSDSLYDLFRSNMIRLQLECRVTPLPLDSINAAKLCAHKGLHFDMVHIDAGHDYTSAITDLESWGQLADVIVMDDYAPEWPEVVLATNDFAEMCGYNIEAMNGKAILTS